MPLDTYRSIDPLGRLTAVTDPLGRTTAFGYDRAGNLSSRQEPGGSCGAVPKVACTTFGYDAADQPISIAYSDATPAVSMAYDADGRRTSMTDGTGTSTSTWDSLDRLVSSTSGSAVAGGGQTTAYSYDLANQLTGLTYPGGLGVSRGFDAAGNLTAVTDWAGRRSTFSYDEDNDLLSRNLPGLLLFADQLSYDAADRLVAINDTELALLSISSYSYGRDSADQVTSVAGSGTPADNNVYAYTPLNQLASVNGAPYAYDHADNLTRLANGTTQAFDAANQLCWAAAASGTCGAPPLAATRFGYDSRGNRTSRTPPGGGVSTYAYDLANRLTAAAATTYAYDGDGLRMAKTTAGATTAFGWDRHGAVPLLLTEGTAGATTRYVYGPGDQPLEQADAAGNFAVFHQDQLGSTRVLTNDSGVVGTATYDAYGRTTATTGTTSHLGFAGEYTDAETGFVYLRNRYYDPATAQFISKDPIAAITQSPYGYVGGNPLNGTDPMGLCSINPFAKGSCLDSVENGVRQVRRAVLDVVAVVPYGAYYASYYALKGINAVGDRFGPVGTVVSRVVGAPLVSIEGLGLALDIGIDYSKPEDWADESRNQCDKRPINPLHSIPFVPNALRGGPELYLPGAYRDDNGHAHVTWEW